jgi:SAM-dependent methyltransferase
VSLGVGYRKDEIEAVPDGANLGLGCGAPIAQLALRAGETVLDLGSGAGIDAFLAAREVGPGGRVIGVDMTPEMVERARSNGGKAGLPNVEFREGRLESLPVEDASIDAVTSNCVINLVPDKARVFAEIARVLKPGGRLVVSDIVLDGRLPERVEKDIAAYVGCVAGAAIRRDYFGQLRDAGLGEAEILKDVDYLAGLEESAPDEAHALLERTGVRREDVAGKVRSITFRARRAR